MLDILGLFGSCFLKHREYLFGQRIAFFVFYRAFQNKKKIMEIKHVFCVFFILFIFKNEKQLSKKITNKEFKLHS